MATTIKAPKRAKNEKGGKFRLLVGAHLDQGPPGCHCEGCAGSGGKNHLYTEGDVIESKQDLVARFNQGPHSRKFERVSADTPATPPVPEERDADSQAAGDDLEGMSARQLLDFAATHEIDTGGETRKGELLKIIRAAMGS